jgi:hypothetical protein
MDRARYAVDAVVIEGRSVRSVASSLDMSKSWVAKQAARFRAGGYEALAPKSKAPLRRPTQLDVELENEIVMIRKQLSEDGFDAGPVTTVADVVAAFYQGAGHFGLPASMLTDNGCIFTAQFRNGRCGFETELATLGITIKHGKPYHPQTQGKIERFHQTLKRWLRKQDPAASIAELQGQVDYFVRYYNETRPHSARGMVPPRKAFDALTKASPDPDKHPMAPHTRVRHDKIDKTGVFTLRHGTKLHHVGVGRAHTGRRVIVLVADLDIRVLSEEGELLRHLTLDPDKDYQPLAPKALAT